MYPNFLPASSFFVIIIISTLDHLPTSFCIDDALYVACVGQFQCANIPNLEYPFWGNDRPESCGHPGFQLNCHGDFPLLTIQSRPYRVLGIDIGALNIRVIREDLLNDTCPRYLYETSLDYTLFKNPPNDQNLTLYYGCPKVPGQLWQTPYEFDCTVNGTDSNSYFVTRQARLLPNVNLAILTCSQNIQVPINETAARALSDPTASKDDLRAVLAGGFGLEWEANDTNCNTCARSGGRCGYNTTSASFACLCIDRPYTLRCNETGLIIHQQWFDAKNIVKKYGNIMPLNFKRKVGRPRKLSLAKLCLERNIPYLGICRGSQVLNVACGGTLYQDIGKELTRNCPEDQRVVHMDYDNYDGHRHLVKVVESTPLNDWFKDSLEDGKMDIWVNSYHHQGVKKLAQRFVPMAFAPDGLIEGFYDPDAYNSDEGKFIMGLQFHPERMRRPDSDEFDYPGCPAAYKEFVKAVVAYQKKLNSSTSVPKSLKLDQEMENKRKVILRSFSLARNIYAGGSGRNPCKESELEPGAEFLESNTALSLQQEKRLKQMGATVRNASSYSQRLKLNAERERLAKNVIEKMSVEQVSDLMSFYQMMGMICSDVLERKLHGMVNDLAS